MFGFVARTSCSSFIKLGLDRECILTCRRSISSKDMMKAVIIKRHGGPNVLEVAEVSRPSPAKSDVLVKVYAAGVNPVDLFIREGAFARLPTLPMILGKEAAGVVKEVGSEVQRFRVGDRVTCCLPSDGGYSEYVVCNENHVLPLSTKLSFAQGSTLYVSYFVAYRALITKCKIQEGEKVFIHGASGGVGIAAIQIAKSKGLTVFGSARSQLGRDAALNAGADYVFDHSKSEYLVEAYGLTKSKGFDVILENCADTNLGNDLMMLAPCGRIAVVGTKRSSKVSPRVPTTVINPRSLMYTEGCIHGVKLIGVTPDEFVEYSKSIVDGVEEGWLQPYIGRELSLSQANLAHNHIAERPANGKIVLTIEHDS